VCGGAEQQSDCRCRCTVRESSQIIKDAAEPRSTSWPGKCGRGKVQGDKSNLGGQRAWIRLLLLTSRAGVLLAGRAGNRRIFCPLRVRPLSSKGGRPTSGLCRKKTDVKRKYQKGRSFQKPLRDKQPFMVRLALPERGSAEIRKGRIGATMHWGDGLVKLGGMSGFVSRCCYHLREI